MKKWYLYIVIFIAGAAVLAIEILGTRILGPFYGVSLFLWSALITVTLVALSAGYALGGRWADKGTTLSRLYYLIAGAGVWVLVIPWLKAPILLISEPFGLRFAVLVAAFILFVPPLTLLGMVSPYAIRVSASSLNVVGRTAGDLYAISTVGSVTAALLTGFILIPSVGVNRLTVMIGLILLISAFFGLALELKSKTNRAVLPIILLSTVILIWLSPLNGVDHAQGVTAIKHSPYAEIRVLDSEGIRFLIIDGGIHTVVDPASWESYFPYVSIMGLSRCMVEKPGDLLLIGLGGGSVVKSFAQEGWAIDAVEIDPVITKVAQEYFGLNASESRIFTMDGRQFLIRQEKSYDIIAMDAFGSSSIPFHLITVESFELIASRLKPGGIFAINIESNGWHGLVVQAISATLGQHFEHVIALPTREAPDELSNVVIFASNSKLEFRPEHNSDDGSDCRFNSSYYTNYGWSNRFFPNTDNVPLLTDDLNPVDLWSEEINTLAREALHTYFNEYGLSSY